MTGIEIFYTSAEDLLLAVLGLIVDGCSSTLSGLSPCSEAAFNARYQRRREAPSAGCRCYAAPNSRQPVAHEHDLAYHASFPEQLLRLSWLGKRKSLRDEWLDLFLLKEIEQGDQIRSKQCRFQPLERLDAVGDHPFPARENPSRRRCTTRRWGFHEGDYDGLYGRHLIPSHVARLCCLNPPPSRRDGEPRANARGGHHRWDRRRRPRHRS